ncbi:hypothetical protein J2X48_000697 [Bosea sp. BE271]|uniref:hypothetical protein n=1 Tax=Bosea TaxID=85413 RepID=UPI00285D5E9E|nr:MULTISPECIES: hypothetical protein [Bosea]MDR6826499.1 hypothetical protein [Bosea robiniae]MDR6893209.1 hypothetical protein [Bosea sp. BE109]MDR7137092.1 hypothetical protein [Bosea sp. BE168]MDR7173791.1 hypothetical protein [Bosea sp. BE271]
MILCADDRHALAFFTRFAHEVFAASRDERKALESRALAAEAALAAAEDLLCNLMNAAGHYKSTHSEDDRAALSATIKAAADYAEAAAIRAEGE